MRSFLFSRLLIVFFSSLLISEAFAQKPIEPGEKYWIFFTDKVSSAAKQENAEPDHVQPEAKQRRVLRGSAVPRQIDFPLSDEYLGELAASGVEPLVQSRWLNGISALLTEEQFQSIKGLPFIREIRKVARVETERTSDNLFQRESHYFLEQPLLDYGPSLTQLAIMNAVLPLERGINGQGVRLGFLDTEFADFQHPVFDRLRAEGRVLADSNFTQGPQENYHGVAVASVAVGYQEGVLVGPAHGAFVLAATTEYAPTETTQEEDNFVAGLEWLESLGVDVVNSSLGYTTFDGGIGDYTYADLNGNTAVTTRAVDIAAALGVVVVTSAGNSGTDPWRYIGTPADADSAIAVGGVNPDSTRSSFSSFGPTADGRVKPDVSAMGSNVVVAGVGNFNGARVYTYNYSSGTSFASPLVAGVVCQMLQVNPRLTPIQVREILITTASQAQRPDSSLGYGIINADAAIRAADMTPQDTEDMPDRIERISVFPNPSTGSAEFEISLSDTQAISATLSVYDVLGRLVAVPFDGWLSPDVNRVTFDGNELPGGIYIYVLKSENLTRSGKLVVIR